MGKKTSHLNNSRAMTLVEILVALVILGLILVAIFPLLTQSLQVTNLANTITAQLFADQEDIEIVAATKGGVLFADGTFLTGQQFKVLFGENADITKNVVGMTIKKNKLVRFLGSIPNIQITGVNEGYTEDEAKLTITGLRTSFVDKKTTLTVADKSGSVVTNDYKFKVISPTEAEITLPTFSNRFSNEASPYTVTLKTGNEQTSALLQVYLPRAVIIDNYHNMLISSNSTNWITKNTASVINTAVNKIVFAAATEKGDMFAAVGDEGSIYLWCDGEPIQKVTHGLTNKSLNHIIFTEKDSFLAVGDGGVILTSADGLKWKSQNSNTSQNLYSIDYFYDSENDSGKYICVGEGGIVLTSVNGTNWTQQHNYPLLASDAVNGKKAVSFSGAGDYLKTITVPVTGGSPRTIYIVAAPSTLNSANLISWGSPLGTIDGGRFTLRMDDHTDQFRIEQGNGINYVSPFTPAVNTPSLLLCRSIGDTFNNYQLSINGGSPTSPSLSPDSSINTRNDFPVQIGSDPLTRYNAPMNYAGLIAEVMVFDQAISDQRAERESSGEYEASPLDLINKYLSVKYGITLSPNIDDLFYPGSDECLSEINWQTYPSVAGNPVLWLDASTIDLSEGKQVVTWTDKSSTNNHAQGAALLSIACSPDMMFAGGEHRTLLRSNDASGWTQSFDLGVKKSSEFQLEKMVFVDDTFVALANDGLAAFTETYPTARTNGYIAYYSGTSWEIKDISDTDNYSMNDIAYDSNGSILIVGDKGSIFSNTAAGLQEGTTFTKLSLPSNQNNLQTCCIR